MKKYLLLLPLLTACVSAGLAESNLESVKALGQVVVAQDEANMPVAQEAVDTAAELVDASGVFPQIIHLGLPSDLVEKNYQNVQDLVVKLPEPTPEQKLIVTRAEETSAEIAGKQATSRAFVDVATSTPLGKQIEGILGIIGGIAASIYGATRGRKHIARWWNEPGKEIPPAPPAA